MNGPLNILLMESDSVATEELLIVIDRCGHIGHPVKALADARDRRGRLNPEVMLFSAELWAHGGAELVTHYAEKGKVCRVLLCGDAAAIGSRAEFLDEGVQAVLQTPLSSGELAVAVDALMAGPPAGARAAKATESPTSSADKPEDSSAQGDGGEPDDGAAEVRGHIMELAGKLGRGEAEISAISPVAAELQSLTLGAELPNRAALIEKIERDPNIASSVLRAANSVAYRGMPRVLDLDAAGRRLGSRNLGEIAQTAALRGAFEVPTTSGWSELLNRMWRNTVTTAHDCRLLASSLGSVHPGQAYSMALFHNLGEVLVVDLYKERGETPPPAGKAVGKLLRHMDQHHSDLGEILIRSWGLPGSLSTLARCHHDPAQLPSGTPLGRSAWLVAACFAAVVDIGADYKEVHSEGPPLAVSASALGVPQDRLIEVARRADAWWKGQEVDPQVDYGTGEVVPDEPPTAEAQPTPDSPPAGGDAAGAGGGAEGSATPEPALAEGA